MECDVCKTETNGVYICDWLYGIVTKKTSVDLCKNCHKHMIEAVEKAWEELHLKTGYLTDPDSWSIKKDTV